MAEQKINMKLLEDEIASVEIDTVDEENLNAQSNYAILDDELQRIISQIPFPSIGPYDTGIDYEDISGLQYKKKQNKPYWDKQTLQQKYCDDGSLYCGHVHFESGSDYYIMDSSLESRALGSARLINTDDRNWSNILQSWRYPDKDREVTFSRNLRLEDRSVLSAEIVIDRGSELFANITDAYLRKALVRNKNQIGMQSIIQTIQKKQDKIRSLPAHDSFIVQGCAGSGKTMVLLHRLRYLIFNNDLKSDEYIFLAPSKQFVDFIADISTQFKIASKNIVPVQSYYRMMASNETDRVADDVSELVFDPNYLTKVYSKEFLKECYHSVLQQLITQTEALISVCDNQLNQIIESEALLADEEISRANSEAVSAALASITPVLTHLSGSVENLDSIALCEKEIRTRYESVKASYEKVVDPDVEIEIASDDERLVNNPKLLTIQKEIEEETELAKKASIFTARAHKNKLAKLQNGYDEVFDAIKHELIEEEKKALAQKATQMSFVYEGITIENVEYMLSELTAIIDNAKTRIDIAQDKKKDLESYIEQEYSEAIQLLNDIIDDSASMSEHIDYYVSELQPAYEYFISVTSKGAKLLSHFNSSMTGAERDKAKEQLRMFSARTEQQSQAYLNTLLMNACKKNLKDEFGITICKLYKHYWYIALYCQYLTRSPNWRKARYIYIDEAQDLSEAEIELIYKLNSKIEEGTKSCLIKPVINMFGDINQMITTHGIKSWEVVNFVSAKYELDENFRNPNQIIDFCNQSLPFSMKKVGVDMAPVDTYSTLDKAISQSASISDNPIFIVKDEYAKSDLTQELSRGRITDFSAYTVKEVKGLEFKETFVIERDMSMNEKYIAYTRALVKMNVIQTLPHQTDTRKILFVQGDEVEE